MGLLSVGKRCCPIARSGAVNLGGPERPNSGCCTHFADRRWDRRGTSSGGSGSMRDSGTHHQMVRSLMFRAIAFCGPILKDNDRVVFGIERSTTYLRDLETGLCCTPGTASTGAPYTRIRCCIKCASYSDGAYSTDTQRKRVLLLLATEALGTKGSFLGPAAE